MYITPSPKFAHEIMNDSSTYDHTPNKLTPYAHHLKAAIEIAIKPNAQPTNYFWSTHPPQLPSTWISWVRQFVFIKLLANTLSSRHPLPSCIDVIQLASMETANLQHKTISTLLPSTHCKLALPSFHTTIFSVYDRNGWVPLANYATLHYTRQWVLEPTLITYRTFCICVLVIPRV